MKILEEIKAHKIKEVHQKRINAPVRMLEQQPLFKRTCISMTKSLTRKDSSGIIAEFKRKSPSKGDIHKGANPQAITTGYVAAGAAALSVLTDQKYFGAHENDILIAREHNNCPILRKDFIVDDYQIMEAKAMGADVVLLIAKILTSQQVELFTHIARQLGMEVLLEIHSEAEMRNNHDTRAQMVGINNRNLDTFEVDIENSIRLAAQLPKSTIKIAESGLQNITTVRHLKENGFQGFLMGEHFMKQSDPAAACETFIKDLRHVD